MDFDIKEKFIKQSLNTGPFFAGSIYGMAVKNLFNKFLAFINTTRGLINIMCSGSQSVKVNTFLYKSPICFDFKPCSKLRMAVGPLKGHLENVKTNSGP
jgi:hypothetical protein